MVFLGREAVSYDRGTPVLSSSGEWLSAAISCPVAGGGLPALGLGGSGVGWGRRAGCRVQGAGCRVQGAGCRATMGEGGGARRGVVDVGVVWWGVHLCRGVTSCQIVQEKSFDSKLSGSEIFDTNALLFLIDIVLCS